MMAFASREITGGAPARFRFKAPAPLQPLPLGLLYYPGARCPACGGHAFDVGRVTAECVRCDGALVIADSRPQPISTED